MYCFFFLVLLVHWLVRAGMYMSQLSRRAKSNNWFS